MPQPTIERLASVDGERLRAIRLCALKDAPYAFSATFEESAARPPESWRQQLEDLATFVAVEDGRDVGLVRGGPHPGLPDAAHLLSMWVAPEARGRGVGLALIDAIKHWARRVGYSRIVLDVGSNNPHARALYERAGFVPTGVEQEQPPPRAGVREIQMSRDI